MKNQQLAITELKGGLEAAIQGLATALGPLLLYIGLFGATALSAGLWAALITASVVHGASLLFRGQRAIIPSSRVASLAAYVALVIQLSKASASNASLDTGITLNQLQTGLAAGSVMFLVASLIVSASGLLKWGHVFKMIPTPVTAGIANGTALLLTWLALQAVGKSSAASGIAAGAMLMTYLAWPKFQLWARRLAAIPAVLVALAIGFFLAWLLEPPMQVHATPISGALGQWVSVTLWPQLAHQDIGRLLAIGVPGTVTLALVMILETFTATSVMETRFGIRVDANRELLVLGGSNIVSSLVGGVPSTGSTIRSVSSWIKGGRGWLASASCLAITTLALAILAPWLLALPAGVMAGLFLMQAALMLDRNYLLRLSAMVQARRQKIRVRADLAFWIATGIALVAFFGNLIWACFTGIALSCLIVLRRLSENLNARWAYLDEYHSRRVRSVGELNNLTRMARRVGVLRLSGHLFFGNSARVTELADEIHAEASVALVDVSQISDVDPSGSDALVWLLRALQERGLQVIVTGVGRTKAVELKSQFGTLSGIQFRNDLDRGLEAAEDQVLMHSTVFVASLRSIAFQKNELLHSLAEDEITSVLLMGEVRTVNKGEVLFHKDEMAHGVWLLEEGMVSIVSANDQESSRLSTFGPGQFLGEMGFIDGKLRSATAVADTVVKALLLDNDAIASLSEQKPHIALKLTRNIARELSHRVRSSSALFMEEPSEDTSGWVNSSLSALSRY